MGNYLTRSWRGCDGSEKEVEERKEEGGSGEPGVVLFFVADDALVADSFF